MELKDSNTLQNLKDAFAGESQANRRYLCFAAKADVEGENDVAANEDLERSTADRISAVHFLRFELDPASIAAARSDVAIRMGINHNRLGCDVALPEATRESLVTDLG